MLVLLLHLLLSLLPGLSSLELINVSGNGSDKSLEYYLCRREGQAALAPNVVLQLNSSAVHRIGLGDYCVLNNLINVTIQSSSASDPAIIKCNVTNHTEFNIHTARGFAFINTTNLTLSGLHFMYCGGSLNPVLPQTDNHTLLPSYFGANQLSAVYISHAHNLTLNNIAVSYYYGFAIAVVNTFGTSVLKALSLSNSMTQQLCKTNKRTMNYTCYGSGLFIYSHDDCTVTNTDGNCTSPVMFSDFESNLLITDSEFYENYNFNFDFVCIHNVFQFQPLRIPLVSASALTVFFAQSTYNVNIKLTNSTVFNNTGSLSGGLMYLYLNTPYTSQAQLFNVTITENAMLLYPCPGTGLVTYIYFTDKYLEKFALFQWTKPPIPWTPFIFNDSIVSKHIEPSPFPILLRSSTVYISMRSQYLFNVQVTLDKVKFHRNKATNTGICLKAETMYEPMLHGKKLVVFLRNIIATNNKQANTFVSMLTNSSQFVFYRIQRVHIEGTPPFVATFRNNLGSVIDAFATDVYLKGNLVFHGNEASLGSCLILRSDSHLILSNNTSVLFEKNTALLNGGAIYSVEEGTENDFCSIQIDSNTRNVSDLSINMTFVDNKASLSGNSMYVRPYQHCFQSRLHVFPRNLSELYSHIFNFVGSSEFNQTASLPSSICKCGNRSTSQCGQLFDTMEVYPGDTIQVQLIAHDENGVPVESQVSASFSSGDGKEAAHHLSLRAGQVIDYLFKHECHALNYTIFATKIKEEYFRLNFAVPGHRVYTYVNMKLKECPPGFVLSDRACKCNEFVQAKLICDETHKTIQVPLHGWVGVFNDSNESYIGYSNYCPYGYCNSSFHMLSLSGSTETVCLNNREGPLCGNCKEGYSAVQGGNECRKCDNDNGLFWSIGSAATGIIAVIILFLFKLTLNVGTIGGVVFYANTFDIINIIPVSDPYMLPFVQFLEFINLHQGFPTCFFNGMDYSFNIFHRYVFSVYIWLIVATIILIAHCSAKVARFLMESCVQVLMTFIHLSFVGVLISSINTFSFTKIHTKYEDYTVWLYNGSVKYGTGIHIPLIVVSLLFLNFFIIPYILLATLGSYCLKFSIFNKFRSFFDTIYGPYRDKYRYWFGLRLILLVILALLSASLRGSSAFYQYMLQLILLIIFMLFQAYLKPFKEIWANHLDNWCMLNVLALTFINLYSYHGGRGAKYILLVALLFVIATAVAIIGYHVMMFVNNVRRSNKCCAFNSSRRKQTEQRALITTWIPSPRVQSTDYESTEDITINGNCTRWSTLREPILEYINEDTD